MIFFLFFWGDFLDFLGGVFRLFGIFQIFRFFSFSGIFWGIFFCGSKLLRLLLKVTEVTTEHQKWPEISKKKAFFYPKGKKAPSEALGRS